jgi:hypothetical protein
MAEADTQSSTSEQAAGEQKPVVEPVSIEIKQGQKTGVHRALASKTIKIAEGVKTDVVRIRTLGIQIAQRIETVFRKAISAVAESWERIEVRRWRQRRQPKRGPVKAVAKELWPPDGKPPLDMSTGRALQKLGDECERQGIDVHPDTLRRALGRR